MITSENDALGSYPQMNKTVLKAIILIGEWITAWFYDRRNMMHWQSQGAMSGVHSTIFEREQLLFQLAFWWWQNVPVSVAGSRSEFKLDCEGHRLEPGIWQETCKSKNELGPTLLWILSIKENCKTETLCLPKTDLRRLLINVTVKIHTTPTQLHKPEQNGSSQEWIRKPILYTWKY